MYTNNRFRGFGFVVVAVVATIGLAAHAAVTNNVPKNWAVTPSTDGAYLEGFEGVTLPNWASGALVTNAVAGPFPDRSNVWFSAHTSYLQLDGSAAVTNSFTNTSGAVSFATNALFVDMRIKFDLLDSMTTGSLAQTKFALFANAASNLVVAVNGAAWTTNLITLDLSKWYQVTVKMKAGLFDVLTNDVVAFSGLAMDNSVGANTLSAMSISGTAMLDDLYVSGGNPAYPSATMGGVPPGVTSFGTPDAVVTNWLANFFNDGRLAGNADFSGVSSSQLDAAFLLDTALAGTPAAPTPATYAFGISAIDPLSDTSVRVTAKLTTGASPTPKVGPINGKIVLRSRPTTNDSWSVSAAVSPTFDSFGKAAITFPITSGHRFFDAQIVDPATP